LSTGGTCQDVTFRFNHLTNSPGGWNIVGRDGTGAASPTSRISIHDNIHPHGAYGVKTDGQVEGTQSLDTTFGAGAYTFDHNVAADCASYLYPAGANDYPSWPALRSQFVDVDADELELIEGSDYRADGLFPPYDQDLRGADIACLDVLLEGVDTGVHGE